MGHEHSLLRVYEPYPGYHQRLETDIPTIIRRIEPPILESGQSVLSVSLDAEATLENNTQVMDLAGVGLRRSALHRATIASRAPMRTAQWSFRDGKRFQSAR